MAAWASGDYAVIGTTLQIVGEQLAEACDLLCDEQVLDVAAGNGNATLAAARRGCRVVSTDYVAALLERGEDRARAERLNVTFQVADAEALPFADASFDAVLSTFGVMFAPEGFVGQMFKTLGRHMPPPPGAQPPSQWGTEAWLHKHFDEREFLLQVTRRTFNFRYRSAEHFIDTFRSWYGPIHKAFAALPPDGAKALEDDLAELLNRLNRAGDRSMVVPSEYLEVVITRR
jgi:SAM-dependent methyltransferase